MAAPVAVNDNYTTNEDTALGVAALGILGNDTDVDGDALTASVVSTPANGTVTLNTLDGSFTYTPDANFNGTDSFTYQANDGTADSNVATVTLTVTPVNDAPVALDESYTIIEDTTFVVAAPGILGNDTDVDGDALIAFLVSTPAHFSFFSFVADGSFIYTPDANFNGTDSFTYQANDGTADSNVATVTLTVTPVNDAPIAVDDTYTTNENTALTVAAGAILANDTDVDGGALTVSLVSGPANGTVTLNPDGEFTYTPAANFNGTDSFTYTANDGQADSNVATVTLTVTPAIQIVKFVNGQDADMMTGPHVAAGSTLTFTYVVTDTGGAPLANVVVTDDKLGPITSFTGDTNGDSLLDTTETWTYTATATAVAGQQTNTGTVTAEDPTNPGTTVSDDNPANYFGDAPAIQIVKLVNGQDADSPTGPHVAVGSTVTFTYVVTDTGNVPLANVVVTDDKLGAITTFTGDINGNGLLDLTETWTYTQTATALAGQQTNVGTVTAQDFNNPPGTPVTDDNPANYFGDAPAIQIVKFVNGDDADIMTGPHVAVGSPVTFTYQVTNTGNVPLANVAVTDDNGTAANPADDFNPTFGLGDSNGNGLLDLTETWTYTHTATAVAGQQTNLGTVNAQDPNNPPGTTVSDNNPANYFGDAPVDLAITKTDSVTSVVPGASDIYTIVVANNGPSTVSSVTLTDTIPAVLLNPSFSPSTGAYDVVSGEWSGLSLAPGGSVSMTLTGTIDPNATGSLTNTAMVAAPAGTIDTDPTNNTATDTDTLTPQADLSITKTDGVLAVVPGTSDTYTIVVSNTGPSAVTGATVSDPLPAGVIAANWAFAGSSGGGSVSGDTSGSGALATTVDLPVNASVTFTFTVQISPSATGTFLNVATVAPPAGVTDNDPIDNSVTDTDTLTPQADLVITKTDGVTTVLPGTSTTYNIVVTNDGPSTAVNSTVIDLFPAAITAVSWTAMASPGSSVAVPTGFGNIFTPVTLLPDGFAIFTAVAQISPSAIGSLTNTATVAPAGLTDTNPGNNAATDTDVLGAPAIQIVKFVNGEDADMLTGPLVAAGSTVTFTYVVTDTGPVPLSNVVVIDDKLGPITSFTGDTNNNGLLDTTETWTYTATATALAGQQTNLGTVTALEPNTGTPVTDSNPANYFVPEPTSDDFNGDGRGDILFRHDSGEVYLWAMNGLQTAGEGRVALVTNDWHIQGVGDFNGDGNSDFLWRQDSGQVYFWEMDGLQIKEEGPPPHAPVPNDWHIEGTGDFDGDFKSDILWRHDSGQVYLWEMDGLNVKAEGSVTHAPVTTDWHVQGVGDFNGDGNSDVLWHQDGSGQVYVWEMNGQQVQAEGAVAHAAVTSDWHVQGIGDFNGDGNSDVLWRQDGSGQVYVWEMNGQQVQAEGAVAHAPVTSDWHIESVNDFNGDGNSDVLWRQDVSGQVYVWQMNGQQVQAEGAVPHAPVPSDWHVFSDLNFI
jgi:uncharacterized repeat protein (TIGR01451 family)